MCVSISVENLKGMFSNLSFQDISHFVSLICWIFPKMREGFIV
jgi:hypothetical protein